MDLVHWCLLIMGVMPIVCAGISKAGARGYDNRNPREWLAAQEGYRKRAVAAQQNCWEAFAYFTAAMVVRSLWAAERSCCVTGCWTSFCRPRGETCWPVSWDVVVAVDIGTCDLLGGWMDGPAAKTAGRLVAARA